MSAKNSLWSVLVLIVGAIAVWLFSRRRMDVLYGEVSRLREVERKYDTLLKKEAQRNASFAIPETDIKEFEEEMAKASPEKKMRMAMLSALYKNEAREALGDDFIVDAEADS